MRTGVDSENDGLMLRAWCRERLEAYGAGCPGSSSEGAPAFNDQIKWEANGCEPLVVSMSQLADHEVPRMSTERYPADGQKFQNRERELTSGVERLIRPAVATLDAILGQSLLVLDDGFVRVIDYMGNDAAIVQAARVSYGAGTKRVHDDRGLVRYLMRHLHTTPFEMCELKLHVRVPMDVWRQWIRHRTANVNEYSTRYSVAINATQRTPPNEVAPAVA